MKSKVIVAIVLSAVALMAGDKTTSSRSESFSISKDERHHTLTFTNFEAESEYSVSVGASGGKLVSASAPSGIMVTPTDQSELFSSATATKTAGTLPDSFNFVFSGYFRPDGDIEEGSDLPWDVEVGTEFYYIKSDQEDGEKEIVVPAGTSVTYTAYEGASTKNSNWTVNGQSKNNESSIIFNRNWWDVPGWFSASMGTPDPDIYSISASPVDRSNVSDSGVMTVVGVASVGGHGKISTREEAPGGTDKWTDEETIYAQPQSVVHLAMSLTPSVTPDDNLKNSINWSVSGWTASITPDESNKLEATFKPGSCGDYVVTASCGSSQRLIRIKVSAPKIHSVTFDGNIIIYKDTGGSYSGEAWKDDDLDGDSDLTDANADSSKKYSPIAYRSTSTMSATAVFKPNCLKSSPVNDKDFIIAYDVEAAVKKIRFAPYSSGGINNWSSPTNFNMAGTTVTAANPFHSSPQVGYHSSFELAWEVGFGESGTSDDNLLWERSYSEHELYLTYNASTPSYETVFHIGCTNGNGTIDKSSYISSIWNEYFSSNNVQKKGSDKNLKYWGTQSQAGDYPRGYENLLNLEDGRCGEWNQFFQAVIDVQGFSVSPRVVSLVFQKPFSPAVGGLSSSASGFLVKNWSFGISSGTGAFPYRRGEYTAGTNSGKGNPNSQPWFWDHVVSDVNGQIYDPSYGLKTNSKSSYQNSAVAGWFDNTIILSPSPSSINDFAPDNATNQVSNYNL